MCAVPGSTLGLLCLALCLVDHAVLGIKLTPPFCKKHVRNLMRYFCGSPFKFCNLLDCIFVFET